MLEREKRILHVTNKLEVSNLFSVKVITWMSVSVWIIEQNYALFFLTLFREKNFNLILIHFAWIHSMHFYVQILDIMIIWPMTMSHAKANVSWCGDGGSAGEMGNFIPIIGGRIIWMLDKGTDIKYLSIGNIIPGQINKDRLTKRNFWFYWKW